MRQTPHTLAAGCAAVAALLTAPLALASPAAAETPAAGGSAAAAAAPEADFNGDGLTDVVAAAPEATVSGEANAGYVTVLYGTEAGAAAQHKTLTPSTPTADGYFGRASVARDLDADGYADLAVLSGKSAVVHWGSSNGLSSKATELPDSVDISGYVLTGGDFDGDGNADLVVGNEGGQGGDWGQLNVLYGPFDRDATPDRTADLDTGRTFAPHSLTAGDITGDGKDDLVTTHSFEEMSETSQFWAGSADGLSTTAKELPDADTATIGDVDNDGYGDLVIRTVPGGVVENLPDDHGTIQVLYGTKSGPSTSRTTKLTQNSPGIPGANEDGDQFGDSLAAGDADGDGYADIAVGVPYEDLGSAKDAGATVLLKGGSSGLSGAGSEVYHQDTAGVSGVAEAGDRFGDAVTVPGDGTGFVAGAPGEDTDTTDSGAAWLRLGTSATYALNPGDLGTPGEGAGFGSNFAY